MHFNIHGCTTKIEINWGFSNLKLDKAISFQNDHGETDDGAEFRIEMESIEQVILLADQVIEDL